MAEIPAHDLRALSVSPVAEALMPRMPEAVNDIVDSRLQNGYTVDRDGAIDVNLTTEMPDVAPPMIDWWFGWHSDSAPRYKLWQPLAHIHAQWEQLPPAGSTGRARYVGSTSQVDEFLGSAMIRGAIQFRRPEEIGLVDAPIDMGYLVHHVSAVAGGSVMRSRFWIGPPYIAARKPALRPFMPLARRLVSLTELDARALLVHCAQEMNHLATFLPAIYEQES